MYLIINSLGDVAKLVKAVVCKTTITGSTPVVTSHIIENSYFLD